MTSRRAQREESWDSLHLSEVSTEASENIGGDEDSMEDEGTPHLRTIGDVHKALHPLQATADRVGRQVERFAETLDRLSNRSPSDNARSVTDIVPIVWEFEKIAAETVKTLRRYHEKDRQASLKKAWRRRLQKKDGASTALESIEPTVEKVEGNFSTPEDLRHWEQELQTWQLLRLMLQVKDTAASKDPVLSDNEERFRRPIKPTTIHRYSPENDVWNAYLAEDKDMWERNVVVEWLKMTAESSELGIDAILETLEAGSDGEDPLSAGGWMYSKEAIKAQKRLRSWPQPLDPGSPGLDATLATTGRSEGTITQLDPDAVTRQERALAKDDVIFERALWLACWEMVRRGRSWDSVREWCKERSEGWRAISIRGDPRSSYDLPNVNNDSTSDWQSRSLWRKMCLRVAKEGGTDDFERAVYGALSGDLPSVLKVTDGWDDYLFAVYNSQLLQGFDSFIQKSFPERLPKVLRQDKTDFGTLLKPFKTPPEHTWQGLMTADQTKVEAKKPLKMIQGSIIASKVSDFVNSQGRALGKVVRTKEGFRKSLRTPGPPTPIQGSFAEISVDDHDVLRILTHISFLFMDIKPDHAAESIGPIENIVFAYVDYLGKAGKQQLLPLYASRLSAEGAVECMARQLPYITEHTERRTVIRLMQQYGMDVAAILKQQLLSIMADGPSNSTQIPSPRILDRLKRDGWGMPSIRDDFIGEDISDDQLDLIHGVEWYLLLDGYWQETMWAGKEVYLYFLRTGALTAAKALKARVSFSSISQTKTRHILGKGVDLSEEQYYESEQTRLECEILINQSIVFQDLENLVAVLGCLEDWKEVVNTAPLLDDDGLEGEEKAEERAEFKRQLNKWKSKLRVPHENLVDAIEPLLTGNWLQQPDTEAEAASLSALRLAYLPDLVFAYIAVLTHDGQFLTRELLVSVMDLAATIAEGSEPDSEAPDTNNSSTGLSSVFIQAGRMAELVDVLAKASVAIVASDEAFMHTKNRPQDTSPRKRKGDGGWMGVWRVQDQGRDIKPGQPRWQLPFKRKLLKNLTRDGLAADTAPK